MSIHPRYAEAILDGEKRVELRKAPLRANTTHVVLYATSPVQRVVGVFTVSGVDVSSPIQVWRRYSDVAGVTRDAFTDYYGDRAEAVAIRVADPRRLETPLELTDLQPGLRPPQSIVYLNWEAAHVLDDVLFDRPVQPEPLTARLLRRMGSFMDWLRGAAPVPGGTGD